jgi:ABC-type multidrug transport system permease subunit
MLFLAIMFIAQSFSADIWKERLNGTLRRVLGTPQPAEAALGGKVMATALVLTAIGAVGLTCSVLIFQIPVARPALALVWIVTAGTALYLLMMCVQVLATSERAANVLASMLIFPLAMLGGSFFPFALMPGWLATIGRRTPNGWAVAQLHSLVEGSVTSATLPLSFAGAAIIAAGAFLFVARRVQQGFAF